MQEMGCLSSKAAVVPQAAVTEAWALSEQEGKKKTPRPISRDSARSGSGHTTQKDHQESSQKRGAKRDNRDAKPAKEAGCPKIMMVQEASEDTQRAVHINSDESIPLQNSRINSASSNDSEASSQTTDSGLGDEEHTKIITEKSAPALQEIANVPDGLELTDLTIDGTKLATLIDPFDHRQKMAKKRKNEPHTLSKRKPSTLKQVTFAPKTEFPDGPNIIKHPSSHGGMAFDILLEDNGSSASKREPEIVARLKKKQRVFTKEDLDEKQGRAQQRREVIEDCMQVIIKVKFKMHACTYMLILKSLVSAQPGE